MYTSEMPLQKEELLRYQAQLFDPTSLAPWQQRGLKALESLDFPTTRHEEWKYTNLQRLLKLPFAISPGQELLASERPHWPGQSPEGHQIVLVNGFFRPDLSHIHHPASELLVLPLCQASTQYPDLIKAHLDRYTRTEEEALTAFNAAFAQDGLFVYVPARSEVREPIFVHQITDSRLHNTFAQPRMLWVFEEGSRAVLVDQLQTLGQNASWNNAVSEIYVGEKAHIQHYKIQNDHPKAHLTQTTEVHQKGQSIYENITISLNGGLLRNNLHIALEGEHIESNMFGLFMLTGQTLVDNHSIADHRQPNSVSNELYKGILDEHSTGVFNGKIYVRPQAQKTNAYQQNRTILLKDTASINTKPQLEIWADDVKCSHGATTGNLDESSLFYLRARGVPEAQARALLIRAFGNEIVEKIKLAPLRQYLEQEIDARLGAV